MTKVSLILVHGRSQQGRRPAEIEEEWIDALREGLGEARRGALDDVEIVLPYYGDDLQAFVEQSAASLPADILVRGAAAEGDGKDGTSVDPKFREFQAAFGQELEARLKERDPAFADAMRSDVERRGLLQWRFVHDLLKAADVIPGISADSIERFTRDVFLYLSRSVVQKKIDEIVGAAIPETPSVVLAHSLGSVVAFNVLRRSRKRLTVPTYITVGCPLGIGPINRLVERPIAYPASVTRWFNALDARDVVALYPLDDATFPMKPPVENYCEVHNGTDNAHGISGYLSDPIVAAHIADSIARARAAATG